uniref:Uncharacterized protein n=1 Tax=Chelydra serpentina TaxID=8475 RepID=A0A8C3XTP1_CHESE
MTELQKYYINNDCCSAWRPQSGLKGPIVLCTKKHKVKDGPCCKGFNCKKIHLDRIPLLQVFVVSRELMLISHQNRTEQLQEALRQKILNEDNWREKMEIGVAKDQARHTEEIFRLKEDARMELDIERQKHQELIAKYQKDQEELQMKIPELISSAINNLRMEVGILKNQLQEAQIKLAEKDGDKEEEMRSLKRLVTKLEFQLKKEQNNSDSLSEGMRKEIKEKSDELEKLTQEQAELIQNLSQTQEENSLLQETVRRECEERYELTEALTQAREQVLELKRLSGNFSLSQCSLSQGSLTSCTALVSNHGQKSLMSPNSGKGVTHSELFHQTTTMSWSSYFKLYPS